MIKYLNGDKTVDSSFSAKFFVPIGIYPLISVESKILANTKGVSLFMSDVLGWLLRRIECLTTF